MITLATNTAQYQVPTNFDELTWSKYIDIVKLIERPVLERLHNITKIPLEELSEMPVTSLHLITEVVSYIDIPQVLESYGEISCEINIGAESYGKLEISRQAIMQSKSWVIAAQKVCITYLQEDITDLPAIEAMTKAKGLFVAINNFLDKFKALYEGESDPEEELAGVEVFRKFGSFPTIDRLAIAYNKSHDDVLLMPAEIVMTKLLYDKEQADYQDRLMKIKSSLNKK
jgi:hypothetical protein